MKLIQRKDIDPVKWDLRIKASSVENIFCYTWYLDTVSKNWCAFVTEDYQTIFPIPFISKLGIKQIYQAPFTRELTLFGDAFTIEEILPTLQEQFKSIAFRNQKILPLPYTERVYQELKLDADFQTNYRTNAKRLIKKAQQNEFHYMQIECASDLIDIFKKTVAHKIDSIKLADLVTLEKLMFTAMSIDQGELIGIKNKENKLVGGGFFLKDKKRITYLKGACFEEEKKQGAMYGLMDFAMQKFALNYNTFDFGGSAIEGVANFYKKFGAQDCTYYDFHLNKMPTWFQTLKKIKKK